MRGAFALLVVLSGCSAIFGLESPTLVADARSTDARPVDTLGDGASSVCPPSYAAGSTGTYRVVGSLTQWVAAQQLCIADSPSPGKPTHLAIVTSDQERTAVIALATNDVWIGLSDLATEGTFIWVTTETTTYPPATEPPWGGNEPNGGAVEDCVRITKADSGLRDTDCTVINSFVCECDDFAADPSRY